MISYKNFHSPESLVATIQIDHYEGKQLPYITKMLDGQYKDGFGKRSHWREHGVIPRTRNIIANIVDKSATLFNKPPSLTIWPGGNKKQGFVDNTFNDLMYQTDWKAFFQNVCSYTRLLKTTIVMAERIVPEDVLTEGGIYKYVKQRGDLLKLTMLHQGNSCVELNSTETKIVEFAYLTYDQAYKDDKYRWTYRKITLTDIIDVLVDDRQREEEKETILSSVQNPYGVVPIVAFYDNKKPNCGVWLPIPEDLVCFQEMLNLWLTDTENAMRWQMIKQLFINADIKQSPSSMIPYAPLGHTPAGQVYNDINTITSANPPYKPAGLGDIVRLENDSNGNPPVFEWKGPDSDLVQLNDVMTSLIKDISEDWSVKVRTEGGGSADSGFKLVVEQSDNLTLRETQGQFFQCSMRHLYNILCVLYPELTKGDLIVDFAPPSLPVNNQEELNMWIQKLNNGLATKRDYFIKVDGLSEEEADAKVAEIDGLEQKKYDQQPLVNTNTTTERINKREP